MTTKTKQIELHSDLMLRKEQGTYVAYFASEGFTVNLQESALTQAKLKALALYNKLHPTPQSTAENAQQTKQLEERTICNGNVVLFKRERSKRWQARIKRYSGSWLQYSTGTADFRKAKANAEERYRDIRWRQDTGKVDISKRFKDVCHVAKNELEKEYDRTKRQQVKDKIRVIDKYLVPYLGNYDTHKIDGRVLEEFDRKREERIGKTPTKSTINTHNSALNYCFDLAKRHNYITEKPLLTNTGRKDKSRRDYFDRKELQRLHSFFHQELKRMEKHASSLNEAKGANTKTSLEVNTLLRDVVLILINTGIRPGNELLRLRWSNVEIRRQKVRGKSMDLIYFNLAQTKTGKPRKVLSWEPVERNKEWGDKRYGSWIALERIKSRFDDLKDLTLRQCCETDDFIFRLPSTGEVVRQEALTKNFKKILTKADLLKDRFGTERVLYSLRHTYASRRRYEGMSYEDLALNMGTSAKLLQDVYSHFSVDDKPERWLGNPVKQR